MSRAAPGRSGPVAPFAGAELPRAQTDPADLSDAIDVDILHVPTVLKAPPPHRPVMDTYCPTAVRARSGSTVYGMRIPSRRATPTWPHRSPVSRFALPAGTRSRSRRSRSRRARCDRRSRSHALDGRQESPSAPARCIHTGHRAGTLTLLIGAAAVRWSAYCWKAAWTSRVVGEIVTVAVIPSGPVSSSAELRRGLGRKTVGYPQGYRRGTRERTGGIHFVRCLCGRFAGNLARRKRARGGRFQTVSRDREVR